jgi:hypothetical protein
MAPSNKNDDQTSQGRRNPQTDSEPAVAMDTRTYSIIGWTMGVVMGMIAAIVLVSGTTPDLTSVSFLVPLEVISFIAAMALVS